MTKFADKREAPATWRAVNSAHHFASDRTHMYAQTQKMEDMIIHKYTASALVHVCVRVVLIVRRLREHGTGVLLYRACTGSAEALFAAYRAWRRCPPRLDPTRRSRCKASDCRRRVCKTTTDMSAVRRSCPSCQVLKLESPSIKAVSSRGSVVAFQFSARLL